MATAERSYERLMNPIDLVEQLAIAHDWAADRSSDDELTLIVSGTWTDYHVSLNWREDLEALHLACAFDFRVPENRLAGNVPPRGADQRAACGSAISICGPRKVSSCSAMRCC